MATRDDLDTAIGQVEQQEDAAIQAVTAHVSSLDDTIKSLQAKIDAGAPAADFQAEVDRLSADRQKLTDLATANAAGSAPTPPANP